MITQATFTQFSTQPIQVQVKPKKSLFTRGINLSKIVSARFNVKTYFKTQKKKDIDSTEQNEQGSQNDNNNEPIPYQWHTPKKAEMFESKHATAATRATRKKITKTVFKPLSFQLNMTRFGSKIFLIADNKNKNLK